jgi:hypothetical protein
MQPKSKVVSLLDSAGRHWQQHGKCVFPLDALGKHIDSGLNVGTQLSVSLPRPVVTITAMEATSNITLRLTPEDARAHAHTLLQAADMADAVQAEVEARRKA